MISQLKYVTILKNKKSDNYVQLIPGDDLENSILIPISRFSFVKNAIKCANGVVDNDTFLKFNKNDIEIIRAKLKKYHEEYIYAGGIVKDVYIWLGRVLKKYATFSLEKQFLEGETFLDLDDYNQIFKNIGFDVSISEDVICNFRRHMYYKDHVCIKAFSDDLLKISFNFLDKYPHFEYINFINLNSSDLLEVKDDCSDALPVLLNHLDEIMNLNPPFYNFRDSKESEKKYFDNLNKATFFEKFDDYKLNIVDSFSTALLRYQLVDGVDYFGFIPFKYLKTSTEEILDNGLFFEVGSSDVIEDLVFNEEFNKKHLKINDINTIIEELSLFIEENYHDDDSTLATYTYTFDECLEKDLLDFLAKLKLHYVTVSAISFKGKI